MAGRGGRTIWRSMASALVALILLGASGAGSAQAPPVRDQAAYQLARDAYVYAYPIVIMDMTMRQATNVPSAGSMPLRAPINQFAHARAYPKAEDRDVVRLNFDTLYSAAWVDVAREPIVLSVPKTGGRYYVLQMFDMWSDVFAVVGPRTTGTRAGHFALVGRGWRGPLPRGVDRIEAPTLRFWIIGRTQTNGPADYPNVNKIQDGYRLTPLSAWGREYAAPQNVPTDPSVDVKTPPMVQVSRLDGIAMLTRLRALMGRYPPHPHDYPIVFRLRAFGLDPEKPFDAKKLDPATVATINAAAKDALEDLAQSPRKMGRLVNGWAIQTENVGTYGTSYKQRAMIALAGLGANLPEDAIYPTAVFDAAGQPLTGANSYVLRFDKGGLPPVNAFWSITMYDKDGFPVPNPINRFALGDRDRLTFNPDGSLDIYVQAESPGPDKESNWLPAPKDAPFLLTMRLYSPKPEATDGRWAPPGFARTN